MEVLVRAQSKRQCKHCLGDLSIRISAVPSVYIGVTGGVGGRDVKIIQFMTLFYLFRLSI